MPKQIKTYFHGEAAFGQMKRRLTDHERRAFEVKFPEGPPKAKRRSTCERPQRTLYAFYIRRSTTEQEVREVFESYGTVTDVILRPEENGAYVVFEQIAHAKNAQRQLDLQKCYRIDGTVQKPLQFILRKVEKVPFSGELRMRTDQAHDKLRVDFRRVPDALTHRLKPRRRPQAVHGARSRKQGRASTPPLTKAGLCTSDVGAPQHTVVLDDDANSLDDPLLDAAAHEACLLVDNENSLDAWETIAAAILACSDAKDDFGEDLML